MNLPEIPDGEQVFVDANIIIYASRGASKQCCDFLARAGRREIGAVCSISVLAEVCHRLMMLEARERGLIPSANPAKSLAQHPQIIRRLEQYAARMRELIHGVMAVQPVTGEDLLLALELQQMHGLLTNDSLNLASAKRAAIRAFATADKAFDKIPGMICYQPDDLD